MPVAKGSTHKKKMLVTIIAAAVLYLAFCFYAGWDEIRKSFQVFQWWVLIPCLALSCANYILRFIKWHYYLSLLQISLPVWVSFRVFLAGFVMSATPGKFGEIFKAYLIKEMNSTPISRSAPIILAERFTDFIAFLLLSLLGMTLIPGGRTIDAIAIAIIAGILTMVSHKSTAERLIRWTKHLPLIRKYTEQIFTAYESVAILIAPIPLGIATSLSVVSWFMECLAFYLVLWGFDVQLPLIHTTFMYAFATIMGALLMTPGGIGPTEGTLGGLLVLLHKVPKATATSATLMIRICTLWFAVILGLIVLIVSGKTFAPTKPHHFLEELELDETLSDTE